MEFEGKKFIIYTNEHLNSITSSYREHNVHLSKFAQDNNIRIPSIASASGQVLALLTDDKHEDFLFTRAMLSAFIDKIGFQSSDVIQLVNKTDQWGLLHKTYARKYYCIPRPFTYISIHVDKRRKFGSSLDANERNKRIHCTKEYLQKFYIDVPNEEWDIGHIDPFTCSDGNIVMQPPIQRSFRDRFKFDLHGLRLCPTIDELSSNPSKYYSDRELDALRVFLDQ
jgi:hypothetical protein